MKITKTSTQFQNEERAKKEHEENMKDAENRSYYYQYIMEEKQAKVCPSCGSDVVVRQYESRHCGDRSKFFCPKCHTEWETDKFKTYPVEDFFDTDIIKIAAFIVILTLAVCGCSIYAAIKYGNWANYVIAAIATVPFFICLGTFISDMRANARIEKMMKRYMEDIPYSKKTNYKQLVGERLQESIKGSWARFFHDEEKYKDDQTEDCQAV